MISGDVPLSKLLKHYKDSTRENVILLLLRCKKLYIARQEVKKIIMLLIQVNDMMDGVSMIVKGKKRASEEEAGRVRLVLRAV
jgi:hypothetical protein